MIDVVYILQIISLRF